MKKLIVIKAVVLLVLVALAVSSCRTGYGCRGRESWGKMV